MHEQGRRQKIFQGFLKTFQIALIGWIKAGPSKKNTFVFIMYVNYVW